MDEGSRQSSLHFNTLGQMELPYSCTYDGCSKSFRKRNRLEIHIRTHTGERPFVCTIYGCQQSYARSQHLTRHIERVHSSNREFEKKEQCPHCEEILANTLCLQKHVNSFHSNSPPIKPYKCPQEGCEEVFHKKQQLVKHRLQHGDHLLSATKCYSCPHEGCDKQFLFPGVLKRHMKVHQGYPCDVKDCGEVLPNWSTLRKHKATIHRPPIVCNTCGISFKSKSNLNQHLKIHSSDRQLIQCSWEGCSRTFQYAKNLNQHIRSFHEGEHVFKKKPKPRKKRKKISDVARLFGLDDRGKELKTSRHRLPQTQQEIENCLISTGDGAHRCLTDNLTGTSGDELCATTNNAEPCDKNFDLHPPKRDFAEDADVQSDFLQNSLDSPNPPPQLDTLTLTTLPIITSTLQNVSAS